MSQEPVTENEVDLFTIVKEGQSPKLSPKSESFLEYQIAYKEDDQEFYIRVSKNSSSGLFSNSWVRLEAIFTRYLMTKEVKPSNQQR